jgi:hypothetical protein
MSCSAFVCHPSRCGHDLKWLSHVTGTLPNSAITNAPLLWTTAFVVFCRIVCSLLRSPSIRQILSRSARRCDIAHRNSGSSAGCSRAECLFSLLKPYLRVFRGISKTTLPGYLGFFQFLRNFRQLNAFEQAEMILYAALDPAVAGKARQGDFVRWLDHFKLLQSPIN